MKFIISHLFPLVIVTFAPMSVGEETSEDLAKSSQRCWSAFQCAVLAEIIEDRENQEKLFIYGYEEGKRFLEAMRANKITQEDVSKHVPLVIALSLQGPSNDFILGAIWSQATDDAYDDIKDSDGDFPLDQEIKKMIAERQFREKNCAIIVRD